MPNMTNSTPHTSKWMLPIAVSFSCSWISLSAASRARGFSTQLAGKVRQTDASPHSRAADLIEEFGVAVL